MRAMASQSPASRVFTQPFVQAQEKAPGHWPLWGESNGDLWIPRTKASNAENVSIWWCHHEYFPVCDSLRLIMSQLVRWVYRSYNENFTGAIVEDWFIIYLITTKTWIQVCHCANKCFTPNNMLSGASVLSLCRSMVGCLGPLLLIWFNFNPSMNK